MTDVFDIGEIGSGDTTIIQDSLTEEVVETEEYKTTLEEDDEDEQYTASRSYDSKFDTESDQPKWASDDYDVLEEGSLELFQVLLVIL